MIFFLIQRIDYYSRVVVIYVIYSEGSPVLSRKKLSSLILSFINSHVSLRTVMTWSDCQDSSREYEFTF